MSGQSRRFMGINQYPGEFMCLDQGHNLVPPGGESNLGPLSSEFDALPLPYQLSSLTSH